MPIRALEIVGPEWFTPNSQADDDEPARFLVRGLTGSQQALVAPELIFLEGGNIGFTSRGIRLTFQFGLIDWQNVLDQSGKPIDRAGLTGLEAQDLLRYDLQATIAARIFALSFLDPDEKKNPDRGDDRAKRKRVQL